MEFKEELKQYQEKVNEELLKYLNKGKCPEEILNDSVEYSLMAGGKRLRPILVIATYKLFKQDIEKCMTFAMALEMIHNFSLIHDDLPGIDNDDFRHGKPTNHKKFNEATAILAGDALLNKAYIVISNELENSNEIDINKKYEIFIEYLYSHYDRRNNSIEVCVYMFKKRYRNVNCPSVKQVYNWINKEKININKNTI